MIRRILVSIVLSIFIVESYPRSNETELLLNRLDSVLANNEKFIQDKENKIEELRKKRSMSLKTGEQLWLNKMLYDEYYVYDADSAMKYVKDNICIAQRMERNDIKQEWLLNKTFLLTAQGLLAEAEKELAKVDTSLMNKDIKVRYYDTQIYLNSHLAQYIGSHQESRTPYIDTEMRLRREAERYLSPDNPLYYSFCGQLHRKVPRSTQGDSIKQKLQKVVDASSLSTRMDAINAYVLATMYQGEGDEEHFMKYLICSAIADIKTCNRDIASLEELSIVLQKRGEIERGYAYISYCLQAAFLYPNRVRMMNISSIMSKIQQALRTKNAIQEKKLHRLLYTSNILSVILLISLLLIYFQFRKLSRSRKQLNESNNLLNRHVEQLSEAQKMLTDVNRELCETNEKLKESNGKLFEANYVKEEYIGYVFSIYSNYITRFKEYRKNLGRKLKAGQIDDIRNFISASTEQTELKEFYHSFDAIFLHVYPNFVEDFNGLLRPEEKVVLKEGELLNTELRIYALVRLGITDSVKIAEFLHCSPQTVYNNRLKTRNKAIVPKEEFATRVHSLGKIQK